MATTVHVNHKINVAQLKRLVVVCSKRGVEEKLNTMSSHPNENIFD